MGYSIAFLLVLVFGCSSLWQMKKRTKELIKYMRNSVVETRRLDCILRNMCAENGDYCKECNHYSNIEEVIK